MRAKKMKIRVKIAASALILFLFLLVFEGLSAFVLVVFYPHLRSKPELRMAHPSVWKPRDEDKPKKKDWFKYRIVCLGDSCTYGMGVHESEAYPAQLERILNEGSNLDYDRFEVINLGVSGYSSSLGLKLLRSQALAFKPDLVIASFGLNDKWRSEMSDREKDEWQKSIWVTGRHKLASLLEYSFLARLLEVALAPMIQDQKKRFTGLKVEYRVSLAEYQENLQMLIQESRAAGAEVMLMSMAETKAIAQLTASGIEAYKRGDYQAAADDLTRCTQIGFMYYPKPYYYLSLAEEALNHPKKARKAMVMAKQFAAIFPFPRPLVLPIDQIKVGSYLDGIVLQPDGEFDIYARYRQAMAQTAQKANIPYFDLTTIDLLPEEFMDYCHPLKTGYTKVAHAAAQVIQTQILQPAKTQEKSP